MISRPSWTLRISELKSLQALGAQATAKPMVEYLKAHAAEYQKALANLQTYKDKLDKLPALKVNDVFSALGPDTVVVLGPTSARVIGSGAMYKPSGGDSTGPGGGKATFEGEQAITSALLGMSEPTKRKVVFVTATPQALTSTGEYSDIADELKNANFDVLEWSPGAAPGNPEAPPPPATPPAMGKGVVWIVFPPEDSSPQMMYGMPPPNPKPLVDAVRKHLEAGGNVLFLAAAASPMSMMGGGGGAYAFADLLKPFGVEVKTNYTVVTRTADRSGEGTQVLPFVRLAQYPDTVITRPLQFDGIAASV